MSQHKRKVGVDQDYPGSYGWPVYEYRCPDCGQWFGGRTGVDGSDVSETVEGEHQYLCAPCGDRVIAETPEFQRSELIENR
jgi:DNA-directed RNA polymerase subunit RPC12/RpoP